LAAYYNENDPFAAAWLRELIKEGLIADGEVDERNIADVQADDFAGYGQCHFFAGIGGWSYALRLAGWPDDRPVWTGSCPCQPWSVAGHSNGAGDPRDLWCAWFRLIRQSRPGVVFGEQVEGAAARAWLDRVHADLEHCGYAVGACGLTAACVGAAHVRQRMFFVADCHVEGLAARDELGAVGASEAPPSWSAIERIHAASDWPSWRSESGVGVFNDGLPARVVRGSIKGFGNAIVPQVAQVFIEAYMSTT
jgi:DNA (cytosine-5)-methyltransferase 1